MTADVTVRLDGDKLTLTFNPIVLTLRMDGVWEFPPGQTPEPLPYDPDVMSAVQFSSVNGQSLGQAHVGGMNETLAQEYAAQAFPQGKTTTTFADLGAAVATDLTQSGGTLARRDGEHPLLGALGFGYQIGNTLTDISAQHRIGINNAHGSTGIAAQQKGQAPFTSTIAALNAAKNYATSIGKSVVDFGALWVGGVFDVADSKATYQAKLTQLAYDHSTDRKAITGQADPPAVFTTITGSNAVGTGTRCGVARAQHQAAIDYYNGVIPSGYAAPVPVILATPEHFMGYQFDPTGVHVPADWAYILGAYKALAEYHCYMLASDKPLNKRFPPIHPIDVHISGADMIVTYAMRVPGTELAWGVSNQPNGDGFAAQEDYGFAAYNGTTLVALNTPEIIEFNQIRFRLGSGTWGSGYRLGYALDRPTDHHLFYTGSGGNLRDNNGDRVRCAEMNVPLHNWAAPIDINVGASNTWSIS